MANIINPYERGWLAAYRKQPKANPFPPGTEAHADYERAYDDEANAKADGPKFLGPDLVKLP